MRYYFIKIVFILFSSQLIGQQTYFNKRYFGQLLVARSVILKDSENYLFAGGSEYYEIGIMKLNKSGNLINTVYYNDLPTLYYLGLGGAFIKTSNNRYAIAGSTRDVNTKADALLIICDSVLNQIITKTYGAQNSNDTDYIAYNITETNDGGFALIGIKWMGAGLRENILLIKTDRNGNKQWQKTYGNYLMDYGFFIVQTLDGGYLLGGGSTNFNVNNSANATVIKTDSNGNQQWLKYFGGNYTDGAANVMLSNDSKLLFATDYAYYQSNPDNVVRNIYIVKLDYSGNAIWEKKIGKPTLNQSTWRAKTLTDGCIVATGCYELDPIAGRQVGWILKASPNGDSLWMRNYEILNQPYALQYLFDIAQTPDKGFIACGNLLDVQLNQQEVWIIKTDSFGCLVPDCQLSGMDELKTSPVFIKTYPNPASELIYLYFNCNQENPKYSVEITDIKGIVKERFEIIQKDITFGIGLRNYEPGIYILNLYNGKQCIKTEKIIVTK